MVNNMRVYENSFILFVTALEYIESHLTDEFSQEDIAANCYCSLSSLQKTWKYCTHLSLKEYITKRRITLSGRDILQNDISVLDAAMKYGYNSHEVFTRAFTKVWGISPSRFRKEWKGNALLYPKLNPEYLEGEVTMTNKKYDVTEFYDYLRSQAGTYVLCFDVANLMPVNENLGREAGDKVLIEAFRRINEAAEENMLCVRMGGDEFVMITESSDEELITKIAEKVLSQNGEKTKYSGGEVAVSLWCGAMKLDKKLKYSKLCIDFEAAVNKARSSGKFEII
jgi:AraC family transcriptional regulator